MATAAAAAAPSSDPLSALRHAIMSDKEAEIVLDGANLIIEGVAYPANAPTAFRKQKLAQKYCLLSLWLQHQHQKKPWAELSRICFANGLPVTEMVLAPDRAIVSEYLQGKSIALGHIDTAMISESGSAAATDGARAGVALLADDNLTLEAAMRREIPFKTRATVLDTTSRHNLRDFVFARFAEVAAKQAGAVGAGSGGAPALPAASQSTAPGSSGSGGAGVGQKRSRSTATKEELLANFRGTPIIIVPSSATALINIFNAAAFLQDGRFVPGAEARAAAAAAASLSGGESRPTKVTIRRKDARGVVCLYHIVDNVALLQSSDWLKVVAVFAQGPEWQFKGWRWGRAEGRPDVTPTEIFDRCVGFHALFEGDAPHPNVGKWAVTVLPVSKTKRYTDPGLCNKFWELVDKSVAVHKPYLLPRQIVVGPGGVGVSVGK